MSEEEESHSNRRPRSALDSSDDEGDDRRSRLARANKRRRELRQQREVRREMLELMTNDPVSDHSESSEEDDDDDPVDDIDVDQYVPPEEEEGEDLMESMEKDYQRIEALDTYGTEGIDDRDYDPMDLEQRRAAEDDMNRRDHRSTLRLTDVGEENQEDRERRRGMFERGEDPDDDDLEEDLDGEDPFNLEAFDVPLRDWIAQTRTRRELMRRFRAFLKHFVPGRETKRGNGLYEEKIRNMCASNHSSLIVSYLHLMEREPVIATWLADAPNVLLPILDQAATIHTLSLFNSYHSISDDIHVRISHVPITDSLRDLRRTHIGCLVQVQGVVTRRSSVNPQLQQAYYECVSCQRTLGPFMVQNNSPATPESCPQCDISSFRLNNRQSIYKNTQKLILQETPGSVPPGRVPRTQTIILENDLVDIARPGDLVEVTGTLEHSMDSPGTIKSGFCVFSTHLVANYVTTKQDDDSVSNLTEEDIAQILRLSKDPKIGKKIRNSIAPSIFGHDFGKMALALSLFGGVPKNVSNSRVRGDINVLFLGDPGTAKSQMLKYAEQTAPRAVYSTGKGASAVGLTASVHKDPVTREWTLEGGALVLADQGVCLIDEFDKMNEQDRTSIHEAMEQQSISVSKAGIVTSLQARCSVIAAANPIGGRYDSSHTLSENVELTDPILQRFDILCVMQDTVDPIADERLAEFVTSSHMRSRRTRGDETDNSPESNSDQIPQDMLRKYIQYARSNVRPNLRGNTFDQEKVASLYVALRRESAASGGVPIAVRHIESIMRMAEAHAKMHLRDYVRDDDMDLAIRMMLESFIEAQKFSVRRSLKRSFSKFLSSGEDRAYLLLHILQDMFRKEQMYQIIRLRQRNQNEDSLEMLDVPLDEFESRARERRIYDVSEFYNSDAFAEAGFALDSRRAVISRNIKA